MCTPQEQLFDYSSNSDTPADIPIPASLGAGDDIGPRDNSTTRFLFGNINGLQIGDGGIQFRQICREIKTLAVDHASFAEINSNVALFEVRRLLYETTKREFAHSVLSTSISATPCSRVFKPGGVMSLVQDDLVSRLLEKGNDPLGRWSFCKYSGTNGKIISVITIYQVCTRPTNKIGNTAYHQQVAQMATEAIETSAAVAGTPQPRSRFRRDLLRLLKLWRSGGESIILLGDFNDQILDGNSPLQSLFQDSALQFLDIIGHRHPTTKSISTYIRGQKRLDYALITPELEPAVLHCGYLPFHSHFRLDHRFLFLDFNTTALFGSQTMSMPHHSLREFTTKDTTLVVKYLSAKNKYLSDNNFYCLLQRLTSAEVADPSLAERLDKVWVAASSYAANLCRSRRRAWWSIPLNQAIEKKDLLRTCVTGFRTLTNLSSVITARMSKLKIQFPIPTSLEAATVALRATQKEIYEIRNNSKSYREQSMLDKALELAASGNQDQAKILDQMRKKGETGRTLETDPFFAGQYYERAVFQSGSPSDVAKY